MWLKKISDRSRQRGQIPMSDPADGRQDNYSLLNPDYSYKYKKNVVFSPGMGTDTRDTGEVSGNDIVRGNDSEKKYNSFTSYYDVDSKLYGGELMNEGEGGTVRPRTSDRGGPSVGDGPGVLGMQDDGWGSFILNYTPNDVGTQEVAIKNYLRFQKKPSRKVNVNGQMVNVID